MTTIPKQNPFIVDGVEDMHAVKSGLITLPASEPEAVKLTPLQPLTFRRPSEILAMEFSDDANILGDYMIAMEQGGTIVGPPGCGKSRIIFQCAADTIRGKEFLIFPTRAPKQRWAIFNTENSNRRLKADLQRLKNYCGDDWPIVDAHLSIHTLETEDDGFLSLANPVNAIRIEEVIRDLNPLVNVFDPLSEYRVDDLNNDNNMLATCKELGRLSKAGNPKRATLILHHTVVGRAGAMKAVGYDRGSYGRNSKALLGWARSQFNLAPGNPGDNDILIVSCGKCSNGKEFEPFAIRLWPSTNATARLRAGSVNCCEMGKNNPARGWLSSVSSGG
jgi:hypothetical protein